MDKYIIYPKQFRRVNIPIDRNRCFVLMPFDREYDELYGTIKEELTNLSLTCFRDDEIPGAEPFMNKVITNILMSQYVIVVLTDYRPNVLYELGITHTFKDIQNVLILVEKDSKFRNSIHNKSSDISHLTYVEYDSNNLIQLRATIKKYIKENAAYSDFQDALKYRGLVKNLSENENDFIEYLQLKLNSSLTIITSLLMREVSVLSKEQTENIFILFESIIQQAYLEHKDIYALPILMIYADIICACADLQNSISETFILRLLGNYWMQLNISDTLINQFKTDVVLHVASNRKLMEITIPWIIKYFQRTKTSTIDLNRYKLESFLMTSTFEEVDKAISLSVFDDNCYVREHMSDIIGEKRIFNAIENLIVQLPKEENYYTAISMMEAMGKLGFSKSVNCIIKWVEMHSDDIIKRKEYFVLKHAVISLIKLKNGNNEAQINRFMSQFDSYLKGYDYL